MSASRAAVSSEPMEPLVKGRHLTHAGALYQWKKATPDYLASLPDGGIFEYKLELEGRFYITPPTATLWSWTAGEGVILEGMSRSSSRTPRSPDHC